MSVKSRISVQLFLIVTFFFFTTVTCDTDPATFWSGSGQSACAVTNYFTPITTSSGCSLDTDNCVCTTDSFVRQIATCLGPKCPDIVGSTYNLYTSNCKSGGGFTIALTKRDFLDAAGTLSKYLSSTFYSGYPACATDACLGPLIAASGCDITNACVCQNTTLVLSMAECVGKVCTASDISGAYSVASGNCADNGGYTYPLSSAQWLSATTSGSGSVPPSKGSTSKIAVPTSVSTVQSYTSVDILQPTGSSGGGGFTEDQKIALGVCIGVGLPATLASFITVWAVFVRR